MHAIALPEEFQISLMLEVDRSRKGYILVKLTWFRDALGRRRFSHRAWQVIVSTLDNLGLVVFSRKGAPSRADGDVLILRKEDAASYTEPSLNC